MRPEVAVFAESWFPVCGHPAAEGTADAVDFWPEVPAEFPADAEEFCSMRRPAFAEDAAESALSTSHGFAVFAEFAAALPRRFLRTARRHG